MENEKIKDSNNFRSVQAFSAWGEGIDVGLNFYKDDSYLFGFDLNINGAKELIKQLQRAIDVSEELEELATRHDMKEASNE